MGERTKCPACDGWGYHVCDCWPGDCICGFGDETCEDCEGTGFADSYDDDWPDTPPPPALPREGDAP